MKTRPRFLTRGVAIALAASLGGACAGAGGAASGTPATAIAGGATAGGPRGGAARLASLAIPGDPAFGRVAREVIDVVFALDPSAAGNAGLFDDAVRVPSYAPAAVAALMGRLDRALAEMRAMPWRAWPVDRQIDFRWIFANAELARRQLVDERFHTHRLASWLEPLANDLIAVASYAPERRDLPPRIFALVPAMLDEMRTVADAVTRRDIEIARDVLKALVGMAEQEGSPEAGRAAAALRAYGAELDQKTPATEFSVVGADAYAWRLDRALLMPWKPADLLALAQKELARVDAEIAALKPKLGARPTATDLQKEKAANLSKADLLALYDAVEVACRQATVRAGFVTIPDAVGPIHARETPDAMVPLTGDGGSMNPPPPFVASNVGYWNVEHWKPTWSLAEKLDTVVSAENFTRNGLGPYAAHEGFPGHHLQLAIARLHPDPIRTVLMDPALNEGWGLYAEEELWERGGLGDSPEARHAILRSLRFRIARVVYDVNIETGAWTLQEGADFQQRAAPGAGKMNPDILRAINWPTQLITYFAGKMQLLALKDDYRKKMGAAYSERAFHDAFLAEGSIPIALIRAKLLGEPVPGI